MILLTAAATLSMPTWAAPVGDPIANPKTGRVSVDGAYSLVRVLERDSECGEGACAARLDRRVFGVELGLALVEGVGLFGFSNWTQDSVAEARLQSEAILWGGGVRLGAHLSPEFWLAAVGRFSVGQGISDKADQVADPATVDEQIGTASLLGIWGDPNNGGHLWFGVQAPWMYQRELRPLGKEGVNVSLRMKPDLPGTVVVGGALISERLGTPWGTAPRLRTTVEVRLGYENALTVATGLGF
jgi:hypothetical protein